MRIFHSRPNLVSMVTGLIAVCWAALMFFLLSDPNPPGTGIGPSWLSSGVLEAAGHVGVSGVLAATLTCFAYNSRGRGRSIAGALVLVVFLSAGYAGLLESYQSTIPDRNASWVDGALNAAGAIIGVMGVVVLPKVVSWVSVRSLEKGR